jgi:hypothetical protein
MRRNRWCDTPSLGRWHFEHPDCPGQKYWVLDRSGSIYALAELGPSRRAIVKVGKTIRPPMQRINEITSWSHWGSNNGPIQLWGAHTSDRHEAERQIHQRLAPHRVAGLFGYQRETYVVAMDIVLSAMREVADEEPRLLWDRSPFRGP